VRVITVTPGGRAADANDIFLGRAETQSVIGDEARDLRLTEVTFRDGARNRLHSHTTDQVLIVTAGLGIVATEREEREVAAGDIAFIAAGERHWHGARPGEDMTHWAITGAGKTFVVSDDRSGTSR
jgi:quercetin dioxygenase-like cupin family protein